MLLDQEISAVLNSNLKIKKTCNKDELRKKKKIT